MSDRESRLDVRRGYIGGAVAMVPWLVAAIGWTAHWNLYINAALTLGGGVIAWTGLAVTLDRYQKS